MAFWELLFWRPGAGLAVAALGHAKNLLSILLQMKVDIRTLFSEFIEF